MYNLRVQMQTTNYDETFDVETGKAWARAPYMNLVAFEKRHLANIF